MANEGAATNAEIATQDQPKGPEIDPRQQGDNKGGADTADQPQHDEPPPTGLTP